MQYTSNRPWNLAGQLVNIPSFNILPHRYTRSNDIINNLMVMKEILNKVMRKNIIKNKTNRVVRFHMAREVYIGTYNQSHSTATAERTRPSYLALLPSWIHPIIPCASAISDPS